MERWKRQAEEFLRLCRNNEKYVKLAVIILVVIAALVFFGQKGENEEISVTQPGEQSQQEVEVYDDGTASVGDTETDVEEALSQTKIVVDIGGSIKNPGVYEVAEGTRLHEVIELAGGLLKDADTDAINQAEILYDGQKILIPEISDMENSSGSQGESNGLSSGITADGRVNINLADSSELQEIPGVGPATAEKIIHYRESNGRFSKIEDIKNVDGIGDKTFEKIKDLITV